MSTGEPPTQGNMIEFMSEAARVIAETQVQYGRALLQANAALLAAWLGQAKQPDQGPCEAARESEFTQP